MLRLPETGPSPTEWGDVTLKLVFKGSVIVPDFIPESPFKETHFCEAVVMSFCGSHELP